MEWTSGLYQHVIKGGPAGGGFSTIEDLSKFDQALRSHKLLNPEYTAMIVSAKPELNSPRYGFGIRGFPGINSILDMFLDTGYTSAVMANQDGAAGRVAERIRELLAKMN